jgi:FkbM family methyltransferase
MNNFPIIYLGDHKALMRTVWGQIMILDTRDALLAPHLLLDGFWEAWMTKAFRNVVHEGMTVVDVGANIGYYTLMAASLVGDKGRVYSFEPHPEVFGMLTRNVHVNYFFYNVTLVQQAVLHERGKIDFFLRRDYPGNSSVGEVPSSHLDYLLDGQEKISVDAISLDEYFGADMPRIDVIKMDVEGAEPSALQGMKNLLAANPAIIMLAEWSPSQMRTAGNDPEAFLADISSMGFPLRKIEEGLVAVTPSDLLRTDPCNLFLERDT